MSSNSDSKENQAEESKRFDAALIRGARDSTPSGFPPELNALSYKIIGAAMEVHTHLGPGLREKFYEKALLHELSLRGVRVDRQVPFVVTYKGEELPVQVVDTVVDRTLVLELKAARGETEEDHGQLIGYMNLCGFPIGLMINFGRAHLRDGIHRKINYPPRTSSATRVRSPLFASSV